MSSQHDDDLFEDTKMTFGEHLEELRGSLLKALLSLILGFLVGLLFADWVVQRLQDPLKAALEEYYNDKAVRQYKVLYEQWKQEGKAVPDSFDEIENAIVKDRMIFEETYFQADEVFRELKKRYPKRFTGENLDPDKDPSLVAGKSEMIRVFLWKPLENDLRTSVKSLSVQEAFMIWIKAALIFGAVVASPVIFWFIWEFVASGLYPHEKSYVYIFMPMSIGLFLAGAALAFFFVFQFVLNFLFGINRWLAIDPDPRISEWLSFALFLPIGFGISFQLPLVMLFLERIGIFSISVYLDKWRVAVLVIAVLSMLLTPADPVSMLLMFAPLVTLYFTGIALCRYMPRRKSGFSETID